MNVQDFYLALCDQEHELLTKEKEIQCALTHIRALREYYETIKEAEKKVLIKNVLNGNSKKEEFPKEYTTALTQRQKTFLAVKESIYGDTNKIAKTLVALDSGFNFETAKKTVTYHCSLLGTDGIIGAKKEGNKNFYFLKETKITKQFENKKEQEEIYLPLTPLNLEAG